MPSLFVSCRTKWCWKVSKHTTSGTTRQGQMWPQGTMRNIHHSAPPGWLAKQTHGGHHHHDENFRPPWLGGLVRWLLSTHLLYHDFICATGRFNRRQILVDSQYPARWCSGLRPKMRTPRAYKLKEVRLRWYLEKPTRGIFGSVHPATFSAGFRWFKLTDPDLTTMNHLHPTHALETRFHFCKKRGYQVDSSSISTIFLHFVP